MHAKNVLKLVAILVQCHYTKTAQRIFKYGDTQYTTLTLDKKLNSLIYRTLFYVNMYGSYKLLKTVRFFGPPCVYVEQYVIVCSKRVISVGTWWRLHSI